MKNKKLVYILLPLALIIWGLIIFRIIKYVNKDAEFVLPNRAIIQLLNDTTLQDTFTIAANYPDPFKRSNYAVSSKNDDQKGKDHKPGRINRNVQNKRIRWPNITYGGIIENNQQNEIIAIVSIDNMNCLLRKGEESYDVKVVQIFTDSIRLKYQEELKTITKTND